MHVSQCIKTADQYFRNSNYCTLKCLTLFLFSRYIRADHCLYEFTKFGSQDAREEKWWSRKNFETYLNPISMKDRRNI